MGAVTSLIYVRYMESIKQALRSHEVIRRSEVTEYSSLYLQRKALIAANGTKAISGNDFLHFQALIMVI